MCRQLGFVSRKPVAVGQMLIVERDTLKITIVDVDHDIRNSIQEQYK